MNTLFQKEYLDFINDSNKNYCSLNIGGKIFNEIEVVTSNNDLSKGLMFRKILPTNSGMLFYFSDYIIRKFWMKNTLIPLDIIFLDENDNVICTYSMDVEKQKSEDETEIQYEKRLLGYSSKYPCKAAIEINYGLCKELNILPGDHIDIPMIY